MHSSTLIKVGSVAQIIVFGGRVDSQHEGQGGGVSDEVVTLSAESLQVRVLVAGRPPGLDRDLTGPDECPAHLPPSPLPAPTDGRGEAHAAAACTGAKELMCGGRR